MFVMLQGPEKIFNGDVKYFHGTKLYFNIKKNNKES